MTTISAIVADDDHHTSLVTSFFVLIFVLVFIFFGIDQLLKQSLSILFERFETQFVDLEDFIDPHWVMALEELHLVHEGLSRVLS